MYVLHASRDRPVGLWALDDTSPYQDYSGYSRSATGPNAFAAALTAGAAFSTIFGNGTQGTFANPVFTLNSSGFSLEAWVYPYFEDLPAISVLSHSGQYDGLVITDTKVAFVTKYSTTGEARAEYQFLRPRALHVVGVHTEAQNMLYVNGELVATVDISEEQQLDTFVATGNLLAGQSTTGTQRVAMNGVGIYAGTLSEEQILAHFEAGRSVVPAQDVALGFDGTLIPLSKTESSIFLEQVWDTNDEWSQGVFTDIDIESDCIFPGSDDGVSLPSEWLDSFDLGYANTTSIYGATVEWEGEGADVEVSLDGTTWVAALQGQNVSLISPGYNPTDKDLHIRISFPGGITDDLSYVKSLTVTGFLDGALPITNNRAVTAAGGASVGVFAEPIEYDDRNGVNLDGGSLTIGPDTGDLPLNPKTVELWIKRIGSTPVTPTSGRTIYINGSSSAGLLTDLVVGQWSLVHIVYSSAVTGDIVISGDAIVGQAIIYENALTTAEISDIYKSYTGRPVVSVSSGITLSVTEPPIPVAIYAHDWSITAGG